MLMSLSEDTAAGGKKMPFLCWSSDLVSILQHWSCEDGYGEWCCGVGEPGVLVVELLQGHLPAARRVPGRGEPLADPRPGGEMGEGLSQLWLKMEEESQVDQSPRGLQIAPFIPKCLEAGRD